MSPHPVGFADSASPRTRGEENRRLLHGKPAPMPGDPSRSFVPLAIAVLTVSDTRSLAEDRSGDVLAKRLAEAGHRLAARAVAPDDVEAIRDKVKAWIADPRVDVIITTGGTGFTGR